MAHLEGAQRIFVEWEAITAKRYWDSGGGWLQEFKNWHSTPARKSDRTKQKWFKNDEGWFKCNFDGAWEEQSHCAGLGVIIRDSSGGFVAALSLPILLLLRRRCRRN